MTENKKWLIGVLKVMLLSVALVILFVKMMQYRWPNWCFDENRGWGFLLVLVPAAIAVWMFACRAMSCDIFAGLVLMVLFTHAFILGAIIGQLEESWPGIVMFFFTELAYSLFFWTAMPDFNALGASKLQAFIPVFLTSLTIFCVSVLTYQSSLYGVFTLFLGLGYLRHVKNAIKEEPVIPRVVALSLD